MSRFHGSLLTGVFDSNKRFPVDTRMLVAFKEDLINPQTWRTTTLNTDALFNGLITAVNKDGDNNGIYYLVDRHNITDINYTRYQAAKANNEDTSTYFGMWIRIADLRDIDDLKTRIKELEQNIASAGISKEYLDAEIETLRAWIQSEYVTKDTFQTLESRVTAIESLDSLVLNGGAAR